MTMTDTGLLSDNGYAFKALCKKNGYGEKRVVKQIKQYVKGTMFDFTDDNELRIFALFLYENNLCRKNPTGIWFLFL